MAKHVSPDNQKALADRLKREAEASRPAFSETLHARICRALQQRKATVYRHPATLWSRRRWVFAAVAAACLVGTLLVVRQVVHSPRPQPGPSEIVHQPRPTREPTSDPLAPVNALVGLPERAPKVESTLLAGQWAHLDHDARVAASLLIDPLPLEMLAAANQP